MYKHQLGEEGNETTSSCQTVSEIFLLKVIKIGQFDKATADDRKLKRGVFGFTVYYHLCTVMNNN